MLDSEFSPITRVKQLSATDTILYCRQMHSLGGGRGSRARRLGAGQSGLTLNAFPLCLCKLIILFVSQLPLLDALPHRRDDIISLASDEPLPAQDPQLWIYLAIAGALVLGGGAFAGLTIALMGQDEIYLQVLAESGEGKEKAHAAKVLKLLKRGKHWVLVTLLLSNVITNETLPIVLDRSLGGGWPAVLGSTVLIGRFR